MDWFGRGEVGRKKEFGEKGHSSSCLLDFEGKKEEGVGRSEETKIPTIVAKCFFPNWEDTKQILKNL